MLLGGDGVSIGWVRRYLMIFRRSASGRCVGDPAFLGVSASAGFKVSCDLPFAFEITRKCGYVIAGF